MQYLRRIDQRRFVFSSVADSLWGFKWMMTTRESVDETGIEETGHAALQMLGLSDRKLVLGRQVHGDHVARVDESVLGSSDAIIRLIDTDGLYSSSSSCVLGVSTADCAAVTVFVPGTTHFGVVHSGWRSTALNITAKLVEKLEMASGIPAANMVAVVSPCISAKNYEVGAEVVETLALDLKIEPVLPKASANGRFRLSIPVVIKRQLEIAGVLPDNIELPEMCTFGRDELFYSWRRSQDAGRMLTLVASGFE